MCALRGAWNQAVCSKDDLTTDSKASLIQQRQQRISVCKLSMWLLSQSHFTCVRFDILRYCVSSESGPHALRWSYTTVAAAATSLRETGGERRGGAVPGSMQAAAVWPLHHSFTRYACCSFMISQLCLHILPLLLLQVTCLQSVCRLSASLSSSRWGRSCAWPSLPWTLPTSLSTRRLWWSTSLPASQVRSSHLLLQKGAPPTHAEGDFFQYTSLHRLLEK